ncbi:MAG: hypothetical protein QOI40_47, partial [Alphaproteobacteria bacterium]|nr:hypothetical protein [Alphaproteobacteria bacterium]
AGASQQNHLTARYAAAVVSGTGCR